MKADDLIGQEVDAVVARSFGVFLFEGAFCEVPRIGKAFCPVFLEDIERQVGFATDFEGALRDSFWNADDASRVFGDAFAFASIAAGGSEPQFAVVVVAYGHSDAVDFGTDDGLSFETIKPAVELFLRDRKSVV